MKKFAALFMTTAFVVANLGMTPALAAGASFSLSPSSVSVKTGDKFSVSVLVNPGGTSIDTVRIELGFDAAKLEAVSFDLGSLLPNLSPSNTIDNSAGVLSYGAYKFGSPVTNSGTLGTAVFRALSSGSSSVSLKASSKLIQDGTEMNSGATDSVSVTIVGANVKPIVPVAKPATPAVPATPATPAASSKSNDQLAIGMVGKILGHLPKTSDEWAAMKCISSGGCKAAKRDLVAEKSAIAKFTKLFKKGPKTTLEWNLVDTFAYTTYLTPGAKKVEPAKAEPAKPATPAVPATPATPSKSNDQLAIGMVGKVLGHLPKSADEWSAVKCISSGGCKAAKRDLVAEKSAIAKFTKLFKKGPKTALEWNLVDTLAYTIYLTPGAKKVEPAKAEPAKPATPAVPATPAKSETKTVTETKTTQQQAIGWFGKLKGRLPGSVKATSAADWRAVDYMVKGYTPATRNLEAEAKAIKTFTNAFKHLPSSDSDWNVIAAIAYSGAF